MKNRKPDLGTVTLLGRGTSNPSHFLKGSLNEAQCVFKGRLKGCPALSWSFLRHFFALEGADV